MFEPGGKPSTAERGPVASAGGSLTNTHT